MSSLVRLAESLQASTNMARDITAICSIWAYCRPRIPLQRDMMGLFWRKVWRRLRKFVRIIGSGRWGIYCLTRTSFWQIRRITAVIDVVCSLPVLPLSWRFVVERNTLGPSFAIGLVRRISYWLMLRMRKNCLGSMTWWFPWISFSSSRKAILWRWRSSWAVASGRLS